LATRASSKSLPKEQLKKVEQDWKKTIIFHEQLITTTLCFNLEEPLPYDKLNDLLESNLVIPKDALKKMKRLCWFVVNDSFSFDLCIKYTSDQIAAAAVYSVYKSKNQPLPKTRSGVSYFKLVEENEKTLQGIQN
jgi:hypothetical protein